MRIPYTNLISLLNNLVIIGIKEHLISWHPHFLSYIAFLGHVAQFPNAPAVSFDTEKRCVGSVLVRDTLWDALYLKPTCLVMCLVETHAVLKRQARNLCYLTTVLLQDCASLDVTAAVLRRLHLHWIQFCPLRRVYRMSKGDKFHRPRKIFLRLSAFL